MDTKPKGYPKTGGRKLGSRNKKPSILALCELHQTDPFEFLVLTVKNSKDTAHRIAAAKELCQYLEPKKKSVEHSGELNNPYAQMTLEQLKELGKKKLEP